MDETPKEEILTEEVTEAPIEEVSEPALEEAPKVVHTETRPCEACQGDGIWDGVICAKCQGSGKIFKDGVVVLAQGGQTFVASKGKLEV